MSKYQPTYVFKTIYDIDFNKLYALGFKNILIDLDNTIAKYNEVIPSNEVNTWLEQLKKQNYKVFVISNNINKRIMKYCANSLFDGYLARSGKPKTGKIEDFLKANQLEKRRTMFIGDQILTDIKCANKLGITSILVNSIDPKTQKWYTKINRLREKSKIKKMDQTIQLKIRQVRGDNNE